MFESSKVSTLVKDATQVEISQFFENEGKKVLTFVGYSGAGYEDSHGLLTIAENILNEVDVSKTIVNIGATLEGIGAIYEIARHRGFRTTGIVSSQAKKCRAKLSPFVDYVFYVEDDLWGGFMEKSDKLSPVSAAMIQITHIIVGIGGGEIARDELITAKKTGIETRFFTADMNHKNAIETAKRKGLPIPTEFAGAACKVF